MAYRTLSDTCSNNSFLFDLEKAKTIVEDLYSFRDHYIERNGIEKASSKIPDLIDKSNSVVKELKSYQNQLEKANKCLYYLYLGRALNVLPEYVSEAQEYLSKSVKLDPKLVEAWNSLGECYWKNGNVDGAKNCFQGALSHKKNKISLRNLSMTLRQIGENNAEKSKNVDESLKLAKEAVKLDFSDGSSWLVLGNAYLTSFFTCSQNPNYLHNCMNAFNKAEKDSAANENPDLHYNRAIAYKYEEDYLKSLLTFDKAYALDPTWDEASNMKKSLLSYLRKVQDLVNDKGKIKAKRLDNMLNSISQDSLGPYSEGKYCSKDGSIIKLELVDFESLKEGMNNNKVVIGKVVCSVYSENEVPFTFCMVDKKKSCYCVTVYNLAQGHGVIIGNTVALPEPYLQPVKFSYQNGDFDFKSIRVSNPLIMIINGKKCNKNIVASSKLSINLSSK